MVGVNYKLPYQKEAVGESSFFSWGSIMFSAPNSGRGLQPPDICLKSSTVNCKHSSKILKCIKDSFLVEMMKSPTRREALLDLLLANVKELIVEVKHKGSPGCSDHTLMEFSPLRGRGWVKSKVRTLNLRKANFQLFRSLMHDILWETALRGKRVNGSWEIFKNIFLTAEKLSTSTCKKSGRGGRRQEASMAKSRPLSQTKTQNQNA